MAFSGVVSAIVVGAVIGALGRLVVPGRQAVGLLLTLLVGIVAALAGAWLAVAVLGATSWVIVLVVQVALAALAVAVLAGGSRGRRA
ncbi:hypothetical protein [Quadrisphaera sp. DSM 44207]|uniref:hypothetical protein n=1 Tax=Quadrisphaera sp. DSM 44207 TaxID=1881057 RepID=UPI0008910ADF|nr:hypothetical protein [Quadrisphaera sp. DSM 44207]SDQ72034.1 hypothetical protein SAMN05428996_2535 [Quadrisphaera sp. DSM 44207]